MLSRRRLVLVLGSAVAAVLMVIAGIAILCWRRADYVYMPDYTYRLGPHLETPSIETLKELRLFARGRPGMLKLDKELAQTIFEILRKAREKIVMKPKRGGIMARRAPPFFSLYAVLEGQKVVAYYVRDYEKFIGVASGPMKGDVVGILPQHAWYVLPGDAHRHLISLVRHSVEQLGRTGPGETSVSQ